MYFSITIKPNRRSLGESIGFTWYIRIYQGPPQVGERHAPNPHISKNCILLITKLQKAYNNIENFSENYDSASTPGTMSLKPPPEFIKILDAYINLQNQALPNK